MVPPEGVEVSGVYTDRTEYQMLHFSFAMTKASPARQYT